MRDVRQLLTASVEKVADYTWRSEAEVAFYLKEVSKTTALSAPSTLDARQLTECYRQLLELQSRLDTLVGIDVAIAYEFKNTKNKLVPLVQEVRKALQAKLDKALKTLQRAARKNEPLALQELVVSAKKVLAKRLASNYTKVEDYVYVTPTVDGYEYNHYIQIDGLDNLAQDFTYPEYYVVLTARTRGVATEFFLNTLHDFRAPGCFKIGGKFAATQLETVIAALLHADDFVSSADGVALDNILLDVTKFSTPVTSLAVLDTVVQGEFLCSRAQAIAYAKALRLELDGAFGRYLPDHQFKCRLVAKGVNRFQCQYTAVPKANGAPKGIDAHGERILRHQLNLTPDQISSIRRLLVKGY